MLLFAPKPTIPLLFPAATTPPFAADDDDDDDAAAAAAANNNGFDVIVISRPGLPVKMSVRHIKKGQTDTR